MDVTWSILSLAGCWLKYLSMRKMLRIVAAVAGFIAAGALFRVIQNLLVGVSAGGEDEAIGTIVGFIVSFTAAVGLNGLARILEIVEEIERRDRDRAGLPPIG